MVLKINWQKEEGTGCCWTRSTAAPGNQTHRPDPDFPAAGNTPFVGWEKAGDMKNSTKKQRKKQIEARKKKATNGNVNQLTKKRKTFAVTNYWVENRRCSAATGSTPSNPAAPERTPPAAAAEGRPSKGSPENWKWRNGLVLDSVEAGPA